MADANEAALEFLRARRSRPAKTLTGPVPDRSQIRELLTIAARSPDHGKLEPWRFLVLEKPALARLARSLPAKGAELGVDSDKIEKAQIQFADAELAIAVIASPKPSEKIPEIEQTLSAGAVATLLLSAALAAGWGANWVTGWASHDQGWREENLNLSPQEWVVGFIHIGTEKFTPPDRPRPDLDQLVEWIEA